jgi:ubiquitin
MEIIKRGTKTPPNKKVYIIKCKFCGCKFTYMEADIKYRLIGCCDFYEHLECPQCHYYTGVPFIKRKYKGDDK